MVFDWNVKPLKFRITFVYKLKIMKKFLLPLAFVVCFGNHCFAQSFSLNQTGPVTITEEVSLNSMPEVYLAVTNNSSSTKSVQVERTILSHPEGSSFFYCWTQCFTADACLAYSINGSPTNIGAGATTTIFSAHYNSNGYAGINSIEYCFFDANNTTDRTCIVINHEGTGGTSSIVEISGNSNFLSSPQPNPANVSSTIVYNLAELKYGKIVLRNMLGSVIKEIKLDKTSDSKILDVSALNAGIYFYSLVNNGQVISSQRLVVK